MSKYIQSEIRDSFRIIKNLLIKNVPVLFVGTPCQVAGLRSVVGEQPNLLLIDIVCKNVPSLKAYNIYLDEIAHGKTIESVAFRDKSLWGWSASLKVKFNDGTQYYRAEWQDEPFYKGFLSGLCERTSCSSCQFARVPRQGDITLGDFWGIHKYEQSWDDRYGTSLVLVNTQKGIEFFKNVSNEFLKVEKIDFGFAAKNNPAVVKPTSMHKDRTRFFQLLDQKGYQQSVKDALDQHYDIGIVGFWIGNNYGTILTNYALNRVLQTKNLTVCMVDPCVGEPNDKEYPIYSTHREEFEKKYYNILAERNLPILNKHIDTFVIGSDQVWKYELTKNFGHVMFLDFVSSENKKISYAASFGSGTFNNDGEYRRVAAYWLQQFDAVSVRESHAVDICQKQFGVRATHVLDPVFLCDKKEYDVLMRDSHCHIKEDYLFAYILDPTIQKREILLEMAQKLKLKLIIVLDCDPKRYTDNKNKMMLDENVVDSVFVEDFLSLISNAKAVITDSYHGTAFSIIYHKPFISIANPDRGLTRFEALLSSLDLTERLMYPYEKLNSEYRLKQLSEKISEKTYQLLKMKKEESETWLDNALFGERSETNQYLTDVIYALNCRVARSERKYEQLKKSFDEYADKMYSENNKQSFIKNLYQVMKKLT